MVHRTLLSTIVFSLLAATGWAQGSFDLVYLLDGSMKRGKIIETSKDQISVDSTGVVSEIDVGDVKRVRFSDAPRRLVEAQTAIADGQLEDALKKLGEINRADIQRVNLVGADVDFFIAYCKAKLALAGCGDQNAAVRARRVLAD